MSDGKEVKRWKGMTQETEWDDSCKLERCKWADLVLASDYDRVVTELRAKLDVEQFAHEYDVNQLNERVESLTKKLSNSLAEVVELKEGNYAFSEQIAKQRYNIDELRAEVVKARSSFTNSEAEIFNLKKQIATQARVIARAVKALNEYRCSSCLNRDELNCYRYEACSSYKELAAIEKEGAKDNE